MALGRTNGGGSGLSYRVMASAAAPTAAGRENDIVIVTERALGDVQINCASAPTTRSDGTALQAGDVYIAVLTTTVVPFNTLKLFKKNALYGLPGTCFQYDGSAWKCMNAYICIGEPLVWQKFSSSFSASSFSFTGTYEDIDDGDGKWRKKLLSSGTLISVSDGVVKVFIVGAGGGGHTSNGGGGGYIITQSPVSVVAGQAYQAVIGAGVSGATGGTSSIFGFTANGGAAGTGNGGGNGGSGGGAYGSLGSGNGGAGGSNGGNGGSGQGTGGTGQGRTTREFGDSNGDLYSGGGGGGTNSGSSGGAGGAGGGGAGAKGSSTGQNGTANTGGGGGGSGGTSQATTAGGSGIIIISNYIAA